MVAKEKYVQTLCCYGNTHSVQFGGYLVTIATIVDIEIVNKSNINFIQ